MSQVVLVFRVPAAHAETVERYVKEAVEIAVREEERERILAAHAGEVETAVRAALEGLVAE